MRLSNFISGAMVVAPKVSATRFGDLKGYEASIAPGKAAWPPPVSLILWTLTIEKPCAVSPQVSVRGMVDQSEFFRDKGGTSWEPGWFDFAWWRGLSLRRRAYHLLQVYRPSVDSHLVF